MTTKYYAEFLFPGLLFSESEHIELKSHNPNEALKKMPESAFAFELYDIETRQGILENGEHIKNDKTVNQSGRFYPGGVLLTLEEIKSMDDKNHNILISNMEGNGWNTVVKTRAGNYQPIEKHDVIL